MTAVLGVLIPFAPLTVAIMLGVASCPSAAERERRVEGAAPPDAAATDAAPPGLSAVHHEVSIGEPR
jgi:hypothetical protein